MAAWPSIQAPSFPLGEELVYPQVRTEFESGTVQARPVWTRARNVFTLSWDSMSESDYTTLKSFFKTNQGLSFSWTHPATSSAYTVRFKGNSIKSSVIAGNRRRVEIVLEEL